MQRINLLCENCDSRKNSMFNHIDEEQTDYLNKNKSCQHFKKGQIIFYEGNRPLGLYCVSSGKIKVYKTGPDGKEQIIHFAQASDFLGYRALIAGDNYSVTAVAVEDTIACFIPERTFMEMLEHNRDLSLQLMKSLCHELNLASEKLTNMAQKNVRERLAETLLMLHDTFQAESSEENLINITLPREDIANIVGTATETVIRLLAEFRDDKMVVFEGKKIRILDRKKLSKTAHLE